MINYIIVSQLITVAIAILYVWKNTIENIKYYVAVSSLISAFISFIILCIQIRNPAYHCTHMHNLLHLNGIIFSIGILSDSLSITTLFVICTITAMCNFYSMGYIKKHLNHFLCYLNVFSLLSTVFAASPNICQMFIFLSIMSILVHFIEMYGKKSDITATCSKSFLIHCFNNAVLVISMALIFDIFDSLNFEDINAFIIQNDTHLLSIEYCALAIIAFIFIKLLYGSPRYSTIPALAVIQISPYAASGVFIIIRLQNIFECSELIHNTIIVIGLAASVLFSVRAVFASNIKEIITFSTSSQLGLMIAACGFSSYGAAIMLFITHAFSKSSLFFCTGSVVYALSGEENVDNMGGLQNLIPKTYLSFITAAVSTMCLPLLPNYYIQKIFLDDIVSSNLSIYSISIITLILVSILTNTYLVSVIYRIFHKSLKLNETIVAYLNEDEGFITKTIYCSIFFAIFSGTFFYYVTYTDVVWKDIFAFSYPASTYIILSFCAINIIGLFVAIMILPYIKNRFWNFKIPPLQCNIKISEKYLYNILQCKTKIRISQLTKAVIINYNYFLDNNLKPGISLILFTLLILLYFLLGIA